MCRDEALETEKNLLVVFGLFLYLVPRGLFCTFFSGLLRIVKKKKSGGNVNTNDANAQV